MAVDEVVSDAANALMLDLVNGDNQVALQAIVGLVTFTDEAKDCARLHARLHFDLLLNADLLLRLAVAIRDHSLKLERLRAAIEELEEGARAVDVEVGGVSVHALRHRIPVQITFNLLNHFDLLARFVKGNRMGIARSKENLKNLERVTVESVPRDLSLAV